MKSMKKILSASVLCALLIGCFAAGVCAEDANLVHNRLSFAKPGEWAGYSLPNGYTQRLTVLDRTGDGPDSVVTVLVENIYDGKVVDAQEITEEAGETYSSPKAPAEPGVFVSVRQGVARVKGRDVRAGIVEFNSHLGTEDQNVTEWWTNAEIPVFGIVKKVSDGEVEWEIADWGEGDGRPRKVIYENGEIKIVPAPEAAGKMSLADRAAAAAKEAAAAVGDAASRAKETVSEKASAAMQSAGGAAGRAKETIAEKASAAAKSVSETAKSVKDAIVDKAAAAAKAASDALEEAKNNQEE